MFASLFLCHDPGLFIIDELVGAVGHGNDFAHGTLEISGFVQTGNGVTRGNHVVEELGFAAGFTELVIESLAQEASTSAGNVDHLPDEIRVHSLNKIFEVEIHVIDAGAQLCGKVIPEVLGIQMLKIRGGHDEGATALRHLCAIYRQESMCEYG